MTAGLAVRPRVKAVQRDPVAAAEEAAGRRHARLTAEDRVERLNRQILGPRKDPESGAWSKRHRAGVCGSPLGEVVEFGQVVTPDGERVSRFQGLMTCASSNVCLRCAGKIGAARATSIERLAAAAKEQGFTAYLVTLTFAHQRGDFLKEMIDGMMAGWAALQRSRRMRRLMANGGGFVRVGEVTWSFANGFHPHMHALVLSKEDLSADLEFGPSEVDHLEDQLWVSWSEQMAKVGRVVSEEHGVDVIRADDPAMGRYLAKVGMELTRGDLKTGRGRKSMSIWAVACGAMDPEVSDEERATYRAVWVEYTEVVGIGRRRLFDSSRGLFARFGVADVDEQTEAERTEGEYTPYVAAEAPVYRAAVKAGVGVELRELVASRATPTVLAIVLTRRLGREVLVRPPGEKEVPVLYWGEEGSTVGRREPVERVQHVLVNRMRKPQAAVATDGAAPWN